MKNKYNLIFSLLFLLVNNSFASVVSTNKASATLSSSCTVTIDTLNFDFNPTKTGNIDSSTSAHMKCTKGTIVNLQINNFRRSTCGRRELGLNGSIDGTNYMLYNIYTDSSYSTIFTNTGYSCEGVGSMPNITANGTNQDIPLFVRIPANQYVVPGIYSDTVTMMFKY